MEFNIQDYLRDMREEQQEDHKQLSYKIDNITRTIGKHETRLVVVEGTRKTLLWLGTALITALLALAGDLVVNHLSSHAAAAATAILKAGESK